jgi:hypothetical protein
MPLTSAASGSRRIMAFQRSGSIVRDLARTTLIAGLIVLCCFFPALLLITASNLLPSDVIKRNVLSSISHVDYENNSFFPRLRLDHFTECIFVTEGMRSKSLDDRSDSSLRRAFLDAVTSPTLGPCGIIASNETYPAGDPNYFRYWHGTQVLIKPVMLFSTVPVLRLIVFFGFVAAFSFFILTVGTHVSWFTAGVAGITTSVSPLYSQLFLITHASSWIIGFVAAGLILRKGRVYLETDILRMTVVGI